MCRQTSIYVTVTDLNTLRRLVVVLLLLVNAYYLLVLGLGKSEWCFMDKKSMHNLARHSVI